MYIYTFIDQGIKTRLCYIVTLIQFPILAIPKPNQEQPMPVISYFYESEGMLHKMMEALKKQMECVEYTTNLYTRNAQLMAIATQSLSIELALLNLLEASTKGESKAPWEMINVTQWREFLKGVDTGIFWDCYELYHEQLFPYPTEFTIHGTLLTHHVAKESKDGRGFYDLKEDGLRSDNANAMDFAMKYLDNMSPYYAAEIAEDAILQLEITFAEMEKLMREANPEGIRQVLEKRSKAGRKQVSCIKPQVENWKLADAFRKFIQAIQVDGNKVRLGDQVYDRKYVFVLLYYRFIRAGLMYRKLNVSDYSRFVHNALGLTEEFGSFRKSMNNWIQKIDLYGCTFDELTFEMVSKQRRHEQQLTEFEFEVWCMVDKQLGDVIQFLEDFKEFL